MSLGYRGREEIPYGSLVIISTQYSIREGEPIRGKS